MKIENKDYRTNWFEDNLIKIIDQTKLPHQFIIKDLKNVKDAINAIKEDISYMPKELKKKLEDENITFLTDN